MGSDNKNKRVRYTLYSLGLGALILGFNMPTEMISALSPAQKSMEQTKINPSTNTAKSPAAYSGKNTSRRAEHNAAAKTLSPKNKSVFHSLSDTDKDRIAGAHKSGDSAHNELTDVLNEDNKQNKPQSTKQNVYD